MATPTADTYTAASGASVYGGRYGPAVTSFALGLNAAVFAGSASPGNGSQAAAAVTTDAALFSGAAFVRPPVLAALMGDSLTDKQYDYTPWYWQNGLAGGVLKTIHNGGISGNTVANMLARVNNAYTATPSGLAGLPPLGFIGLRAGTNDVGPGAISTTVQNNYIALIAALKTYLAPLGKILIFALPPVGDPYTSYNTGVASYNAFLQGLAAGDSALVWIDDCVNVRDGSGLPVAGMFIDSLHMSGAGTQQMGIDGGIAMASLLTPYGYASPLSADASDVYPASGQWNTNHVNAGSVAVSGAFTGTAPTGYTVTNSGAGVAGTVSVVAADGGDSNTVPWLRVTPTQISSGSSVSISHAGAGATIAAGTTVSFETMLQVRFNAFDSRQWSAGFVYGRRPAAHAITQQLKIGLGGNASLTKTSVFRHALPWLVSSIEASMDLQILLTGSAAFTGSMGSIDFRCITIRS